MKPILFYSKTCKNWADYGGVSNQLDQFIKICIDNNRKIPSNITSVPAVLVKGRMPTWRSEQVQCI